MGFGITRRITQVALRSPRELILELTYPFSASLDGGEPWTTIEGNNGPSVMPRNEGAESGRRRLTSGGFIGDKKLNPVLESWRAETLWIRAISFRSSRRAEGL